MTAVDRRLGILMVAFRQQIDTPATAARFAPSITVADQPAPYGSVCDASADSVCDDVFRDPLRLFKAVLEFHRRIELRPDRVNAAMA